MTTFAEDIEEVAGEEEIIGIVIGEMGWSNYHDEGKPDWSAVKGKLIPWEQARPLLDYEYDAGWGAPDCQAITAWTESLVIFVVQYDGSTGVMSVPRNPVDHMPEMPGG